MNAPKIIFAVAVLCTVGMSTSCTKTDLAEEETLINATETQSIDGREIKEEDT